MPTPFRYDICPICGTRSIKRFKHADPTYGYQRKCMNPAHAAKAAQSKSWSAKKRWRRFRRKKNK